MLDKESEEEDLDNSFQNNLLNKMASGVKQMVNQQQKIAFNAATEIDTLNPMIQSQAGLVKPPQDKGYCQLCYKELGFLSRKFHCSMCSRTCCGQCSKEEDKTRACDFCNIKIENSQIDRFYQLSKVWRQAEMDNIKNQINWYVDKTK